MITILLGCDTQECINTRSQRHEDVGLEGFKGQFCYVELETRSSRQSESVPFEDIPRGGAYWMEDILLSLEKARQTHIIYFSSIIVSWCKKSVLAKGCRMLLFQDQRKGWSDRMRQYLGICIPSGCTWDDIKNNYKEVYEDIHSMLDTVDRQSSLGCFTDEFIEEYYSAAREATEHSRGQKVFL